MNKPTLIEHINLNQYSINSQNYLGQTPLMISILTKSKNTYDILQNPDLDLNIQDLYGNTALMLALNDKIDWNNKYDIKFNVKIIRKILQMKFDINIRNDKGETVLMIALYNMNVSRDIINKILDKNPDPNVRDNNGNTVLMVALKRIREKYKKFIHLEDDYYFYKLLKNKSLNIDLQDVHGMTVLMKSLKSNVNKKIINHLLDKNPNINLKDYNENTALYYGLYNLDKNKASHDDIMNNSCNLRSFKEWCSIIIRIIQNIDVNIQDIYGNTPLILLIHFNAPINIIKSFLKRNPDVNIMDKNGCNALIVAISKLDELYIKSKIKMCQIIFELLKRKSDINIQNKDGYNAVMMALDKLNNIDSVQKICLNKVLNKMAKFDINVNLQNKYGETPLMLCFTNNNYSIITNKILNDDNLDVNILDNYGRNVLMRILKKYNGHNVRHYISEIIKKGIDINVVDSFNNNALYYAIESSRSKSIINLIMKMNPNIKHLNDEDLYQNWVYKWIKHGADKNYFTLNIDVENHMKDHNKKNTIDYDGIKIFRGLKWDKNNLRDKLSYIITDISKLKIGKYINVKFDNLSSWTTNYSVAKRFSGGELQMILSMKLDKKDILLSNFNHIEEEIILKPGKYKCTIEYTNITNNIDKIVSIDE